MRLPVGRGWKTRRGECDCFPGALAKRHLPLRLPGGGTRGRRLGHPSPAAGCPRPRVRLEFPQKLAGSHMLSGPGTASRGGGGVTVGGASQEFLCHYRCAAGLRGVGALRALGAGGRGTSGDPQRGAPRGPAVGADGWQGAPAGGHQAPSPWCLLVVQTGPCSRCQGGGHGCLERRLSREKDPPDAVDGPKTMAIEREREKKSL